MLYRYKPHNSITKYFVFTSQIKLTLCFAVGILLSACSDGGSRSGGQQSVDVIPVLPDVYATGLYSGTVDFMFSGNNIVDTNDEPTSLTLEVTGIVGGQQQVRINFVQFSGTSAIGSNGMFSIPSGEFPLNIQSSNGRGVVATCRGELIFEGFFEEESVSGSVFSSSPFVCNDSSLGPITLDGSFQATFGENKRHIGSYEVIIYSNKS